MVRFNEEQLAVVNAPIDQSAVVSAAAGSGKTTTLVERIVHLVNNPNIDGKIIAISFTNEASKSLKDKLTERLSEDKLKRIQSGTFHSIFAKIIRSYADELGLNKNFTIIDETSTHRLIEQAIEVNDALHDDYKTLVNAHEDLLNKKYTYKHVANSVGLLINNVKPDELSTKKFSKDTIINHYRFDNSLLDDSILMNNHIINKDQVDFHFNFIFSVFLESFKQARETSTITYDQILFTTYLLAINGLLDKEKSKIGYMLIDEFQDTNEIQYEIVKALVSQNIMYIGDINQSIYEFRGAKPSIMAGLSGTSKIYNMSYNYRSHQPILDHSNSLIMNNTEGRDMFKPMVQGADLPNDYLGTITYKFNNSAHEADKVTSMVKKMLSSGISPQDIAILVRNRLVPPVLVKELLTQGVVLNDTTKSADFIKSETVKDVFSFLKILVNPKDIYSFMHTLDRPKKGIGAKTLQKIKDIAKENNMNLVEFVLSEKVEMLTPKLREKVIGYTELYHELLTKKHIGLVEVIDFILERSGYMSWINGLKNSKVMLNNLGKLRELAEEYTQEYLLINADFTLLDLIGDFLLEFSTVNKVENPEGVTISTIHNAKGLEWNYVFIVGCDEGILPNPSDNIESDRRLMYVAMTRAKKGLILTTCDNRVGYGTEFTPSSFIDEAQIKIQRSR